MVHPLARARLVAVKSWRPNFRRHRGSAAVFAMDEPEPEAEASSAGGYGGPTSPRSPGAPPADGEPKPEQLKCQIVSTCNKLEEEPWLPVRGIVTMFRIKVSSCPAATQPCVRGQRLGAANPRSVLRAGDSGRARVGGAAAILRLQRAPSAPDQGACSSEASARTLVARWLISSRTLSAGVWRGVPAGAAAEAPDELGR